jgi:hypothetical protein
MPIMRRERSRGAAGRLAMFDLREAFDWLRTGRLLATNPGDGAVRITGVSTDTRSVRAGELFVALHGEFAALLHHAGMPDAVWGALNATLAAAATSRLWGQHLDWRWNGGFQGFDVLLKTGFDHAGVVAQVDEPARRQGEPGASCIVRVENPAPHLTSHEGAIGEDHPDEERGLPFHGRLQ